MRRQIRGSDTDLCPKLCYDETQGSGRGARKGLGNTVEYPGAGENDSE